MGFYSINNETNTNSILENMNLEDIHYTPDLAGAYMIVAESEHNYNRLMQQIGISELSYYVENGTELVYESFDMTEFLNKAKEFFLNILNKIKQLFAKFFALLNSYIKDDKEFVDKYSKQLLNVNTNNFKFKGFNFTNVETFDIQKANSNIERKIKTVLSSLDKIPNNAKSENQKFADKVDFANELRGSVLKVKDLSSSEFSKELFKYFRNGSDSKEEVNDINVSKELSNISNNSSLKKKAEKALTELEKGIKENIKNLNNLEKSLLKDKDNHNAEKIKYCNNVVKCLKDSQSILQVANGSHLNAIKSQNRQSKAICVSLLGYSNTKKNIKESALSGFEFI